MIRAPNPTSPWVARPVADAAHWDALTAPLLMLIEAEPAGMSWECVQIAAELADVPERWVHDAIAYLELAGRIHEVSTPCKTGFTNVIWFYGPRPDEDTECRP